MQSERKHMQNVQFWEQIAGVLYFVAAGLGFAAAGINLLAWFNR